MTESDKSGWTCTLIAMYHREEDCTSVPKLNVDFAQIRRLILRCRINVKIM